MKKKFSKVQLSADDQARIERLASASDIKRLNQSFVTCLLPLEFKILSLVNDLEYFKDTTFLKSCGGLLFIYPDLN